MEDQGRDAVARTSLDPERIEIARAADMRYVGQEHAVTVDLPLDVFASKDHDRIKRHFDEVHEVRYGTSAPGEAAEIVSLRSTVTGLMGKPVLDRIPAGEVTPEPESVTGRRNVYFSEAGRFLETPVYRRDRLLAGNRIEGPVLIEEHASTTVVLPGDRLEVDAYGNLVITYVSEGE
jgi:N-methylhydantoinase A